MGLLKNKSNSKMTATVADDHLVLSFPNAVEPIVWRKSLDKIGSATFEVKQEAKKKNYNLTLKKTKTTSEIIASFETKEEAINALNGASDALHGRSKKSNSNQSPESGEGSSNEAKKWIFALLAAAVVVGLYYYMTTLIPAIPQEIGGGNTQAATSQGPVTPDATGVPVSADDFLNSMQ